MCTNQPPATVTVTEAMAAVRAGLSFLNELDAASIPVAQQAECLRELARAESAHTSAQARVLAAFSAQDGHCADGQQSPRTWLKWQTQITGSAAAGAVGWMRRLAGHPAVSRALADGTISASWAREICAWTSQLPETQQPDADEILLAAAAAGATLADLAGLAEEMRRRLAGPDQDGKDGFEDRSLRLGITFRGAGRLDGNLTTACAAALAAVLEALGKKTGPKDDRTATQRRHDALEEACRRLIAAGGAPDRAGQPTQIQLHMTLDQLRDLDGAAEAEAAWVAGRATGDGEPGWMPDRTTAAAYACDAQITPIVTGHLNPAALAEMSGAYLAGTRPACRCGGCTCRPAPGPPAHDQPLPPKTMRRLQDTMLNYAADALSGPTGLAAFMRTRLLATDFPAAVSLPWTPAPPPIPSRPTCAARSSPGTGTAPPPAAGKDRPPARCTTSPPGPTAGVPA